MRARLALLSGLVLIVATVAALTVPASAVNGPGFKTDQDAMLIPLASGASVEPIITVGETLPGTSYRFEAIPDGIALHESDRRSTDVFVNHETSTVPFPFNPPFGGDPPTEANQSDFDNAQLSRLTLSRRAGGVLQGSMAITSAENFQRFCSNYLATRKEGFDRPILFTNEEAQDWVFRTGTAWPGPTLITPGTSGAEQSGVVVAYDVRSGERKPIYGMGRHNHENSVALRHYDDLVVLSTDDTFFTSQLEAPYKPAWSQLYSYIAEDADGLMNDEGDLWAFVSDTPGYDDYFDFAPGDKTEITGHFIKVPKEIATGKDPATGEDWLSTDFPGMLPPPSVSGAPPDGPQWVLDQWGNAENNTYGQNVFRFVRLEDIAYDKRPGMSNVVYIADTGRASTGTAPAPNRSTNGRIWKFVFDPDNPTENVKLSILVEGDDNEVAATDPVAAFNEIHQPDNVETTSDGRLLVQEDPSSSNNYDLPKGPNETGARIWLVNLRSADPDGSRVTVAEVDQSADEGPTDVDGRPGVSAPGRLGAWESSGIVDASEAFGPGAFLVTIQAHTLWVEKADGPDRLPPVGKDFTFKREGGQLVLLRLQAGEDDDQDRDGPEERDDFDEE
jgi:Bacterial protein of unknown function (DUF839)